GFELIKFVSEHYPDLPKLIVTGYPNIQDSLAAIKSGVVAYLTKPFTKNELENAVIKSLKNNALNSKSSDVVLRNIKDGYGDMIRNSEKMNEVLQIIKRVKDNKATIFITGESGTGKELVARSIHFQGKFSKAPFIAVNCGGIPDNLLEAELFGYVKGAF